MATAQALQSPPGSSAEYSGDKLIIFTAIFIPIQIICVALRYLARYLIKGAWGLDDILILSALVLQLCLAGLSIGAIKNAGVGHHALYLHEVTPHKLTVWGKYLVAIEFVYLASVNIPKLAILVLYRRLFLPKRNVRAVIYALMGVLIAHTVSTLLVASIACIPFAANWEPTLPGAVCIDKEAGFIWTSFPNIVTDVIMLVLPIPVVWKLQIATRLKIGLTVTFAVGGLGLITAVIRFRAFFRTSAFVDGTWSAVELITWTQVEVGIYLISACLPTYRPLLERIGHRRFIDRLTYTKAGIESNSKESSPSIPLKDRPRAHSVGTADRSLSPLGD